MSDVLDLLRVSPAVYAQGLVVAAAFVGLSAAPAALAAGNVEGRAFFVALGTLAAAWAAWGAPVLHDGAIWGACELGGASSSLSGPLPPCAWAGAARIVALLLAAAGLAATAPAALAGLAGAMGLVVRALAPGPSRPRVAATTDTTADERMHVLIAAVFAALAAGMTGLWLFADRYWLLFAAVAPALALRNGARRPRLGAAVLAAYALIAVAGTRDVFSFYAHVNALADGLVARGVAVAHIDAGYAVNAWRRYLARPHAPARAGRNADVPWVTAVAPARWTIANRLEDGWRPVARDGRGDDALAEETLLVVRRSRPRPQRTSSEFGTAGWRE
jgi:hypothetical protein